MPPLELSSFPEELLEGILAHCVIAPTTQQAIFPTSWPTMTTSKNRTSTKTAATTTPPPRSRLAVLLVSKQFHRIAEPLFYHIIRINSPRQLHALLHTSPLHKLGHSDLSTHIRHIIFQGIWGESGELLRLSSKLRTLDFTIDFDATSHLAPGARGEILSGKDLDVEEFCEGLKEMRDMFGSSLKHVVIRKPGNVYLTQPKPRYLLAAVAEEMRGWQELESVELAFRLSDDSGNNSILQNYLPNFTINHAAAANPPSPGCITALTTSLSALPKLHSFTTLLPSMWNESILRVSANPALERIVLGDGRNVNVGIGKTQREMDRGILGTGLFFTEAKKYARLSELIRAGTSIIRTRAHTLDAGSASPSLSSSASSSASSSRSSSPTCQSSTSSVKAKEQPSAPFIPLNGGRARSVSTRS